jgi:hypothetical protein
MEVYEKAPFQVFSPLLYQLSYLGLKQNDGPGFVKDGCRPVQRTSL